VIARLEELPGVVSAAPADGFIGARAEAPGDHRATHPGEDAEATHAVHIRTTRVGPRFFATLGVPLLEGREFTDRDDARAPNVTVVNDVPARRMWPDDRKNFVVFLLNSWPSC
jgi:hypothetical protein